MDGQKNQPNPIDRDDDRMTDDQKRDERIHSSNPTGSPRETADDLERSRADRDEEFEEDSDETADDNTEREED